MENIGEKIVDIFILIAIPLSIYSIDQSSLHVFEYAIFFGGIFLLVE